MAYNGSGVFNRLYNWVTDAAGGIKILATKMDAEMDGMATGLSTAICRDGQSTCSARIPFGAGIRINTGTIGSPSINFEGDLTSGICQGGAGQVVLVSSGGERLRTLSTGVQINGAMTASSDFTLGGRVFIPMGAVNAPAIAFSSDPDTGIFTGVADRLSIACGGAGILTALSTGVNITGLINTTNLSINGTTGNFVVNTDKFTINQANGNTAVGGTLSVSGTTTLSSALTVSSGGVTLTTGGLTLSNGNLTVTTGNLTLSNGNVSVTGTVNATTVQQGGAPIMPPGVIMPYAGGSPPAGWYECNGVAYNTTTDAALFAVIGYVYGGSGASFQVPDLRGRTIFGVETSPNLIVPATGIPSNQLAGIGGVSMHQLTQAQLPNVSLSMTIPAGEGSHTHDATATGTISFLRNGSGQPPAAGSGGSGGLAGVPISTNTLPQIGPGNWVSLGGSGTSHQNMPPCMMLRWIIKR